LSGPKGNGSSGEHPLGDVGQLILFVAFIIIWVADSFFLHRSTFLSVFIPVSIRIAVLVILFFIAGCLIKSGHIVVSHKDKPEGVVRTGAFRYIRHPLYLGTILFYLGLVVSTMSVFSFALLVVIFAFYNFIAGYEEKLLEERYDEEYRLYKMKTGKWLPRVWRK